MVDVLSMWMPGNQVFAQTSDLIVTQAVEGGVVRFRMKDATVETMFHCPMPTVTRAPGHARANQLDRFMLLFKADEGIVITRIEVWHGLGGLIHDVEWGGDHLVGITPQNTLELHGPGDELIALDYGLNFALRVYPGHGGDLTFVAYGADAYVPG